MQFPKSHRRSWYKTQRRCVVSFPRETYIQRHRDLQEAIKKRPNLRKYFQARLISLQYEDSLSAERIKILPPVCEK